MRTQQAEPPTLAEVVVTATRYEEEIRSVPANVSVITAEDLANSTAKDVPEMLGQEVGIHVYDITGNRRSYRVDRSGFGETAQLNTLLLVDGRRINSPDLSGPDWSLIPLERVERIEIVRGSRGSVLYGDNATDSVINIITKRGSPGTEFGFKSAGGHWDTFEQTGYVRGATDDLSYSLTGRYYNTDGYRDNSGSKQYDAGVNLDYYLSDRATVSFGGGYHKDDTELPGALRQSAIDAGADREDTLNPDDFGDTDDYYAQLTPEIFLLENSSFKAPVSYRFREADFFSSFAAGEFTGNTEIDFVNASPQFVIKEPIGRFANSLTFGLDNYYAEEDIKNESLFFGVVSIGEFELEKRNYGIYVQDDFRPTERLILSLGYRYDKADFEFRTTDAETPDDVVTPDKEDYDKNLVNAGMTFRLSENSELYFSYAQGFRYPALDELFNFFNNTINSDLGPQESDNFEVGFRHRFTQAIKGNLNFFRLDTDDEIFFNPATFSNENLRDETRRQGVEVNLEYNTRPISVTGAFTYRDTKIRGGALSGNKVPNVPRLQGSLDVRWRPLPGLSLTVNGLYVGKRYFESDFANEFEKQDDYWVFNAKAKYNWSKLTLFLDLNNILNKHYEAYGVLATVPVEPALYPSPEFNALAGLRYDY